MCCAVGAGVGLVGSDGKLVGQESALMSFIPPNSHDGTRMCWNTQHIHWVLIAMGQLLVVL